MLRGGASDGVPCGKTLRSLAISSAVADTVLYLPCEFPDSKIDAGNIVIVLSLAQQTVKIDSML